MSWRNAKAVYQVYLGSRERCGMWYGTYRNHADAKAIVNALGCSAWIKRAYI